MPPARPVAHFPQGDFWPAPPSTPTGRRDSAKCGGLLGKGQNTTCSCYLPGDDATVVGASHRC
jgi:hypothetical protein